MFWLESSNQKAGSLGQTTIFLNLINSYEKRLKTCQKNSRFNLKINFITYKVDFLVKLTELYPTFFLRIGPGKAQYRCFEQLKLEYQFSTEK